MPTPPMILRTSAALALALLAGACASYRPLPLPTAPTELQAEARAPFPVGPLSADQIAALVLRDDPDLVAARRQKGVARAQLLQAGLLPDPNFSGALLPLLAGPGDTLQWSAVVQEDLRALITLKVRKQGAQAIARQVDAQLLWQEWQAAGQARLLCAQIAAGDRALELLVQTRDLFAERARRLQGALAQGNTTLAVSAPDLAALQAARGQVDALERQQLQRRHQLNAMLNREPDAPLMLAGTPAAPEPDLAAIDAQAPEIARRRPDLIALRLGYQAQEARTRQAILMQFPSLVLGPGGGSDNSNVRDLGVEFSTTVPIFDRNRGDIAQQRATREQLRAEYQARLDQAYAQARAAVTELKQAERQLAVLRADLPGARRAAEQAASALNGGALDELGYVDLVSARLSKEAEVIALEQTVQEQEVALAVLTGAGLPSIDTLPDTAA
jgi:outer membrane protein TolC